MMRSRTNAVAISTRDVGRSSMVIPASCTDSGLVQFGQTVLNCLSSPKPSRPIMASKVTLYHPRPHMGALVSRAVISAPSSMTFFRDCRSKPGLRAQRLLTGPTSHSVAAVDGSTMISLSAEWAQENETNLRNGSSGPWTRTVRSPASARTDRVLEEGGVWEEFCERGSGILHDRPLDDETGGYVFPQRHEQLARQGDDERLLNAPAIGLDALFEPQRQGRSGLMAAPTAKPIR